MGGDEANHLELNECDTKVLVKGDMKNLYHPKKRREQRQEVECSIVLYLIVL